MTHRYLMRWTKRRQEWLEHLSQHPGAIRQFSNVPFACMQLGWTEWVEEGNGERLTELGREALDRWRGLTSAP